MVLNSSRQSIKNIFLNLSVLALLIFGYYYLKLRDNNKMKNDLYIENISSDIPTFDPLMTDDNVSFRVAADIYEGLVKYNQQGELEMAGAKNYEVSEDGLKYTFHLREDAKWSNGDPVKAEDYVFSFKRGLSRQTLSKYYEQFLCIENAEDIKNGEMDSEMLGVKDIDDYTFEIKLSYKNVEFIHYLTLPSAFPLHINSVKDKGIDWAADPKKIVYNGPYKVVDYVTNGHLNLTKNDFYWDKDNVSVKNVKFLMINDEVADMNKFQTNGEHMTYNSLPISSLEWYKRKFGNQFINYPSFSQEKLVFNMKNEKFKDIRVRKALSMTVNREKIAKEVIKNAIPSYGSILENISNGYFADIAKEMDEFSWIKDDFKVRVEKAKKLMYEAGYTKENPLKIELAFPTGSNSKLFAETVQTVWNEVFDGIVICSLKFEDWKIFLQNQDDGKYEISRAGWIADYNLPSNFTMLYTTNNSCNVCFYSNPEVDELYEKSLKTNSFENYLKIQKQIAKIIMKDYVSIPCYNKTFTRIISSKLTGYDFSKNYLDRFSTKDFSFVEEK